MELNDGGARRRGRGALFGAAAGLVALAAVTAGLVVALGSSSGDADAAPPTPAASRTTQAAEPSSEPSAAASASPAPHVLGHVKSGVHSGDLRFFLLTAPSDAEVYGDPDGSPYTADDAAAASAASADAKAALTAYGFRGGAYRTYLTGDGAYEVSTRLLRFGSPDKATAYDTQHSYDGTRITLGGAYPARAYRLTSGSAESTSPVVAVTHQGDVYAAITVTGDMAPSRALIQRLLDSQYQRLKTGH